MLSVHQEENGKRICTKIKEKYRPNFTIINGENAAGGRGLLKKFIVSFLEQVHKQLHLGITLGIIKEIFEFIDSAKNICSTSKFSEGTPGKG